MNVLIVAICVNIALVSANKEYDLNKIFKLLKGRKVIYTDTAETNEPVETIPIIPGFYMSKPKELSKSLFKYPKGKHNSVYSSTKNKDTSYRNDKLEEISSKIDSENERNVLVEKLLKQVLMKIKNQGIVNHRYDIIEDRSQNTGSNKEEIMAKFLNAVQNTKQFRQSNKRPRQSIIVVKAKPLKSSKTAYLEDFLNDRQHNSSLQLHDELENNAKEVLDEYEDNDDDDDDSDESSYLGSRRRHTRRRIGSKSASDSSCKDKSEGKSEDSDSEQNPGNPYTIHKNKYKQNWPWKHEMTGDHMHINSYGPKFPNLGPSGPELFFGRKWWYFNQDDYKPMG